MRLVVALALLLLLAPAARAAEVARDGEVSLRAETRGRELCLTVFHRAAQFGEECGAPPYSAFRAVEVAGPDDSFGIAVAPSVAEVGVGGRRYLTAAAEGVDARFAIVRARPGHVLRLFDGGGALVGAVESAESPRSRRVAVARVGGARVRAYRTRRLAPDPLHLDRVISEACVELVRGRSSYGTCVGSGSGRILVDLVPPCRSAPAVLGGVVPAAADRVSVVLGNGRRLRGPTYTLPARFGARAFALAVPTGQAIRSVTADGEQGEVVATEKVRREPVRADCPYGGSGSTISDDIGAIGRQRPAGAPQVAATDGDHRLLVADQRGGSGMCIGIDLLPERFPCGPVTPDPQLATVFRQGGAVAAILGSEVAYVDLRLTDGTTRRVPTVPGERYTGRYAGQVRFLVAAVPRVREAILRDAAGHELTRDLVYVADEPQVVGRGRLAGLGVTALRQPGIFDAVARSQLCVRLEGVSLGGLELLGDPILCEHRRSTAPVVALAPCGRPRSALVGVIPRSARGLRVQLADGRTVRPLLAKLGGALLWIARPPRRGRVIAVRYRHHRVPLRLPPRARQCGYVGVGPLSG